MIVDELVARIGLEFSGAENALKAIASVRNFKKEIAAAGGVIFALEGALKAVAISVAETVDQYADFGQAVGASVETIETLTAAAEMSGGSFEDVQRGLKTLTDQAGAAAKGNETSAESFARLGVNIFQANGHIKTADQLIEGVADGLAKMKDPASQVNAAIDVLGKGAIKLLPALTNGRAGMQGFRAEMERIGVVMSETTNRRFQKLGDSLDMLKLRATGAKNILAQAFLPFAESTVEKLNGFLEQNAKNLFDFGQRFANVVTAPFALFSDIIKSLPTEITALLAAGAALTAVFAIPAVAVLTLAFLIAAIAEDIKAFLGGQESQIGDAIKEWENFVGVLHDLSIEGSAVEKIFATIAQTILDLGRVFKSVFFGSEEESNQAFSKLFGHMKDVAGGIFNNPPKFTGPPLATGSGPLLEGGLPQVGFGVWDPSKAPIFDFAAASRVSAGLLANPPNNKTPVDSEKKSVTINAPMTINAANMSEEELRNAIEGAAEGWALEIESMAGARK